MQNVRCRPKNNFRVFFSLTLFLGFSSPFLPGCATSRDLICKEIPDSGTEIAAFKSELDSRYIGRKIASTRSTKALRAPPDEVEVAAWMTWTERTLKRTQSARDNLAGDRKVRKALPYLNEASLSLVSLHGFLEQKKWHKAYTQLERIEENLSKANGLACAQEKEVERRPSSEVVKPIEKPKKKAKKARN